MTPDQSSQIKQLDSHAAALRIDIESARMSGFADPVKIRLAEKLLDKALDYAKEAIGL